MSEVTIWLAVLVVCVGIEIATMGLTTIWFAGGALVSAILAALECTALASDRGILCGIIDPALFDKTCCSEVF